jgi:hypothetical protein
VFGCCWYHQVAPHFRAIFPRFIAQPAFGLFAGEDTQTLEDSVQQAQTNLREAGSDAEIKDVVADKGYHANETLATLREHTPYRTYMPEPEPPHERVWTDKPPEQKTSGLCQSSADTRQARPEVAAAPQRACGAELCPCLRDGRGPAHVALGHRQGSQTVLDRCRRSQPGLPRGPCRGFASCHLDAVSSAHRSVATPRHHPAPCRAPPDRCVEMTPLHQISRSSTVC